MSIEELEFVDVRGNSTIRYHLPIEFGRDAAFVLLHQSLSLTSREWDQLVQELVASYGSSDDSVPCPVLRPADLVIEAELRLAVGPTVWTAALVQLPSAPRAFIESVSIGHTLLFRCQQLDNGAVRVSELYNYFSGEGEDNYLALDSLSPEGWFISVFGARFS